jgi:hypothetical protein
MTSPRPTTAAFNCKLLLIAPGTRQILLERVGSHERPPRVAIQQGRRIARQLQLAVEAGWGAKGVVLDVSLNRPDACAVIEVLSRPQSARLTAVGIEQVRDVSASEKNQLTERIFGPAFPSRRFSRPGWIRAALDWICKEAGDWISADPEIEQYNAAPDFALVRFSDKRGRALWLKATGAPNGHEFGITSMLSKLCPEYLPTRIAARKDWNAWLMADAGRSPICWTLEELEKAADSMAALQIRTLEQTRAFLDAGAFDLRPALIRTHLGGLIDHLDAIMARQPSPAPSPVQRARLLQIGRLIEEACLRLEALEIPDTLVHLDLNGGNILFDRGRCAFTDWCEVAVGNPFITLQYLSLLEPERAGEWKPRLQACYRRRWLEVLALRQIDGALALAPLLALVCILIGRGEWFGSEQHLEPRFEIWVRTLVRRLDRAARDPVLVEALCH